MWMLPSRMRPQMCQEALDAFARHGSTPGVLVVHAMDDAERDGYEEMRLPDGWTRRDTTDYRGDQYRWLLATYPDAPWYGFVADDNYAQTSGFDAALIEEAGDWNLACCNGLYKSPSAAPRNKQWTHIPSCFVFGGELVRAVGWLAPPWCVQATTDETWRQITLKAGRYRYLHDVVVEHRHWKAGGRERDQTDIEPTRLWGGDLAGREDFLASGGLEQAVEKIRAAIGEAA